MQKITKPTLLLNEHIAKANIQRMSKKASASNVAFRPHFKTHFSHEIGEWYKKAGVDRITVSSIDMAVYFAQAGWKDITIAFPCNILEIDTLNKLAEEVQLNLVVESPETASFLSKNLAHRACAFVKIDTGYGRAGIPWNDTEQIKAILRNIDQNLTFCGLLAHFGHTYKEHETKPILDIYESEVRRINETQSKLGLPEALISIGDTPSCSIVEKFNDVGEIRPGNFIFYDYMQYKIGSCSLDQIAVCMVCPVVAVHPHKNEVIIHGGAVHFSKDALIGENGQPFFGQMVQLEEDGTWSVPVEGAYLKSLSQEHGILSCTSETISKIAVGDLVGIIPVHSCLTANLMKDYRATDGRIIKTMNSTAV